MEWLTLLFPALQRILDKVLPGDTEETKQLRQNAEVELAKIALSGELSPLMAQAEIVKAEVSSPNRWTSGWRPTLMYIIIAIIGLNYLIFPLISIIFKISLTLELPSELWTLMEIGLGGYVVGRSAEKVVQTYTNRGNSNSIYRDYP